MALSPAFARVLAAGRAQFNARVVEARRRNPALDTAAFAAFLQNDVDPLVRAVEAAVPARIEAVVADAYDVALDLVGQALVGQGARSAYLDRIWRELMPCYARLIADDPLRVLGTIANAALNVEKTRGARADEWLQRMLACAARIETFAQLRACGALAAWRSGLAHLREGALRIADELPQPVALAVVGASADARWAEVRDRLLADLWWSPLDEDKARLQRGIEVGTYAGLGGPFGEPPQVRAAADGFMVRSADRYSLLIADAFGAVLHPASAEAFDRAESKPAGPNPPRLQGASIVIDGTAVDLDLPAEGLIVACNAHSLAVTSPYTHAIRLIPRR